MKLRSFILTCFGLCVLPILCIVFGAFVVPCQYGETFLGELGEKCSLLENTNGRRMIILGGSAAAFALDSKMLEEEFPEYHPVNFGMYAALGTKLMMDLSLSGIREGDLVILCPEPTKQTMSLYLDGNYAWQGLDGHFELLARMDASDYGRLLGALPSFAMNKLRFLMDGKKPEPTDIYRKSIFNAFGDVIGEERQGNLMPALYDPNLEISYDPSVVDGAFISYMNAYADQIRKKDAEVWFYFCPVNRLALKEEYDIETFYDHLRRELVFPVIGDPRTSVMDENWFYDTNFHLNAYGTRFFTRQLIRDIKAMLLDYSGTEFTVPGKPAINRADIDPVYSKTDVRKSGDGLFSYVLIGQGQVMITGLNRSDLTGDMVRIPAAIDGNAVTALAERAFQGQKGMVRIELPGTIRWIADLAFADCFDLREIKLTSPSPQGCLVGNRLLEGTKARLLVPLEALSSYRTDYRFSVYEDRLEGE